jgi:two-component system sensor histidine kinase KdpD
VALGTGYLAALALTAAVTGVIALIRQFEHASNISMLYLLAVLATAVLFGSGPSIFASAAAFLQYDVLFIDPHYRLTVAESGEWVALGLLLVTGVITGQLASALRNRAREAEARERDAVVLYDVVRLMADPDLGHAIDGVAGRLWRELGLDALVIDLQTASGVHHRAQHGAAEALALVAAAPKTPGRVFREGEAPTAQQRGGPGRWIRIVPPHKPGARGGHRSDRLHHVPIDPQERTLGSLVLAKPSGAPALSRADDRLLSAVANQLRLALERARLRDEATDAEVLRRTDELKTALLNAVSHDLRTPLASIIASAGSLLQEDVAWSDDERREFSIAIEQEAQRLNRLVGNLLDLSRIEAGSLRPEKGWYDIGALIDEVVGRLSTLTTNHHLNVEVRSDLPPVLLDYVEIDEVLTNLIENAIKFTPPGSEVRVRAARSNGTLLVEVLDNGPGVSEQALPHLFEPFYRARDSAVRAAGTGLGLAVASGLVQAHGGRIWVENRPQGGARFAFTLPLEETPRPAESPP